MVNVILDKQLIYQSLRYEFTALRMIKQAIRNVKETDNICLKIADIKINEGSPSGLTCKIVFPNRDSYYKYNCLISQYGFINLSINSESKVWIGSYRYVGVLVAMIMDQNQWSLEDFYVNIKGYSLYQPYIFIYKNKIIETFYVPAKESQTKLCLSDKRKYQVSGNYHDGFIISGWRSYV